VKLQPQPFKLLAMFLDRPGELVTREEIHQRLWGDDTFVDFEQGLNFAIKKIREALGDEAAHPQYIETVPRRGYRFIAPLESVPTIAVAPGVSPPPHTTSPLTRVIPISDGLNASHETLQRDSPHSVAMAETAASSVEILWGSRLPAPVPAPALKAGALLPRRFIAVGALVAAFAGLAVGFLLWRRTRVPLQIVERQITANPPEDFVTGAAISPDGKYVAYDDHVGLYVRLIDSGETRAVSVPSGFQNRIGNIEWFPDSGKLLAEVAGSEGSGVDLWVITILGQASPHLLYRRAGHPAISPDGRLIAFVSGELQGQLKKVGAVLVGGINGESPRQLVTVAPPVWLASPVWSPDGRWIAYATISVGPEFTFTGAIEVRPASGGPAKTLVSTASLPPSSSPCNYWGDPCLRWSPDWRLVFSVSQGATSPSAQEGYSLWAVPVEPRTGTAAARPERLGQWGEPVKANYVSGVVSPTITADGKRLSFLKNYSWSDVYLGELAPGGRSMKRPRRFTLDNRGSNPTSWTRDSRAIIFRSGKSGKSEIFKQSLNETIAEAVARSSGKDCDIAMLSPDGFWMLYRESAPILPGVPASPSRLMRRPVAGGSPEMVLEEPGDLSWDYRCPVKPSSSCVLSRHEGKDLVFYRLDPTRGRGEPLGKIEVAPTRVAEWNIAPDGSRLALVGGMDMYQGRIEVLTFRDHAWREVSVETGWGIFQSVSSTADGEGFFVTSWLPDSFNLLHVTPAGKVSPLLRNAGVQWMFDPLPSPDGKHLAFLAETYYVNVWMLENF
jgi:DNA-binding winged helix-turn-helix (wHTH) protein